MNRCFLSFLLPDVPARARWARRPGSESGTRCARACSPWSAPFPPPPPPPVPRRCSAASQVLRSGPTSRGRPSSTCVLRLPDAALVCAKASTGPPGSRARCVRACRGLRPRRVRVHLAMAMDTMWPSAFFHSVGTLEVKRISRLNTRPARPPVNASPPPLRATAHDSETMWLARPSCVALSSVTSRRFPTAR